MPRNLVLCWLASMFLVVAETLPAAEFRSAGFQDNETDGRHVGKAAATHCVSVSAERGRYHSGEAIHVTIENSSSVVVHAPAGSEICALVAVQRLEGDLWVDQGSCSDSWPVPRLEIPTGSRITGVLGPDGRAPLVSGPFVGGPVAPQVSRMAPPLEPAPPISHVAVVPEGEVLPGPEEPPFSDLVHELEAGTYRAVFSYAAGQPSAPIRTAYSREFVVLPGP